MTLRLFRLIVVLTGLVIFATQCLFFPEKISRFDLLLIGILIVLELVRHVFLIIDEYSA